MADTEQAAILRSGSDAWNEWRSRNRAVPVDLRAADLQGRDLVQANLAFANLSAAQMPAANLTQVDLTGADLSSANLSSANLTRAILREARLSSAALFRADLTAVRAPSADFAKAFLVLANLTLADLTGANFREANLLNTTFIRSNLSNCQLEGAELDGTVFGDIDLSTVLGLDSVKHKGPSTIGIDTIFRSGGRIPAEFLRGAGVNDLWIQQVRSLAGPGTRLYSCFISYSTADHEFAARLYEDLQRHGVRCWFAPRDIRAGRKIHQQIEEAIRTSDRLLLIISESSMKREWVNTEIARARQFEIRESRQLLFPISLVPFEKIRDWTFPDPDTGKDTAREIREYFIPDFSNWKDEGSYQLALSQLLQGLIAD